MSCVRTGCSCTGVQPAGGGCARQLMTPRRPPRSFVARAFPRQAQEEQKHHAKQPLLRPVAATLRCQRPVICMGNLGTGTVRVRVPVAQLRKQCPPAQKLAVSTEFQARENGRARAAGGAAEFPDCSKNSGELRGGGSRSTRVRVPYRDIYIEYKQKWQLQGIGGGDYGESVNRRKGEPEQAKRET